MSRRGCNQLTAQVARQAADPFELTGHPDPDCNGAYTHDSDHEGSPVLKNEHGMYLSLIHI